MQTTRMIAFFGLAAVAALTSVACDDSGVDGDTAEAGGGALSSKQVPGVVAVEIARVANGNVLAATTVGAPKKVKSVLASLKKLTDHESRPRCIMQETTRLTFLDATGKKSATVSSYCAGYGDIVFENGEKSYGVKFDVAKIDEAKDAPFATGDALWGITKIEASRPGGAVADLSDDQIKAVLNGIDLDAAPDSKAPVERCMPSYIVNFNRGEANVASASFLCGMVKPVPASISAQLQTPNAADSKGASVTRGAIKLDPRPIISVLEKAAQ